MHIKILRNESKVKISILESQPDPDDCNSTIDIIAWEKIFPLDQFTEEPEEVIIDYGLPGEYKNLEHMFKI